MPLNTCEPCCNPSDVARGKDSWRQGVLITLCAIAQQDGAPSPEGNCEPCCSPSTTARNERNWMNGVLSALCAILAARS